MKQHTKKQHFVPKFYLRRFSNSDGWLEVLDLKREALRKPVPYGSVCWRTYFYAVEEGEADEESQEIEVLFQRMEDSIAQDWDGTIQRAKNGDLVPCDFIYIAQLVAMLMLRTEASRNNFNRNAENVDKARFGLMIRTEDFDNPATVERYRAIVGENVSADELKQMQEMVASGEYSLSYNNVLFVRFLLSQLEGFFNVLITQKWTVYRSMEDREFITNENPVVEWTPRSKVFFQTPRLRFHQFIAIAPGVMIKMEPPPLPDPFPEPEEEIPIPPPAFETVEYRSSSRSDVTIFNFLLTGHGSSYAYARRKLELNEILHEHKTAGPLKRIYSATLAPE